jgi:dissimilatory sulfite reductase related protein
MATSTIAGKTLEVDADGHLAHYEDWTREIAEEIAKDLEIGKLEDGHWKVINFMREEFKKNEVSPTLRRITQQSGVTTKEMYALFPKGPGKKAARIAGLPKPKGCI